MKNAMYKKILLWIDGSEDAHKAVTKVMNFYKVWNSQIVAFHSIKHHKVTPAVSIYGSVPVDIQAYGMLHDEYSKLGKQILDSTKQNFEEVGVPIETRLIEDLKPERYAIEAAEDEEFDLIVLGSKGHHSKLKMLLGTVAAYKVNNAKCDVLIIR